VTPDKPPNRYTDAMFTGIIEQLGTVQAIDTSPAGKRLLIDPGNWQTQPALGESIAVNGCCLTHAPQTGQTDEAARVLAFDVITETLDKTNLGQLTIGDPVNLEASITASTAMSGHFVQGHIEGLGTVTAVEPADEDHRISVKVDRALLACIIPKGSVAIDGVSLTVAEVDVESATLTVALIPTTLELTNMDRLQVGNTVNIETDMIARTVVHCLQHGLMDQMGASTLNGGQGIELQNLRDAGFVE
jgi:riboflavin synthase